MKRLLIVPLILLLVACGSGTPDNCKRVQDGYEWQWVPVVVNRMESQYDYMCKCYQTKPVMKTELQYQYVPKYVTVCEPTATPVASATSDWE